MVGVVPHIAVIRAVQGSLAGLGYTTEERRNVGILHGDVFGGRGARKSVRRGNRRLLEEVCWAEAGTGDWPEHSASC